MRDGTILMGEPVICLWVIRKLSQKIHALVDSDMFYIDTVKKYPDDHMEKIEIAKQEYNEDGVK